MIIIIMLLSYYVITYLITGSVATVESPLCHDLCDSTVYGPLGD